MAAQVFGAVPMDARARERCLQIIREVRDDPSSAAFRQPVPRKNVAYYALIQLPMDLKTLETRLLEGEYATLEEFANALRLTWRNAWIFNAKADKHGRQVFDSATQFALSTETSIEELYCEREAERPAAEQIPAMQRLQIELFHLRNSSLALWFRDPVSAELDPEYYESVSEPMDLRTALSQIDFGYWTKPKEVEAGVHQIWTNARQFNGEGSAIDTAALTCCITWNARFSRVISVAPRQRKLRRVESSSATEALRLTLFDLCRHLPAKELRQVGRLLGAAAGDPGALSVDLSRAGSEEVSAAIRVARTYLQTIELTE
ncbi:Bromodomain-containing protein [Pavlovales sp. CCMP2436]|nr:Bromodomain-containing protein [Pavlovales sp. CCMP2436]|mmetsp:Transcript_12251/g.30868  ORF Transcript_12251/g.30868 Transcript_12251/m.30868 type:complete len:318 (-) Transcript_12251:52-1005(-)